jgi:apolipoprotein N-acyltransferase
MFAVDWSEWVVRLPGGGGSPAGTLFLLLLGVFLISAILTALKSAADKFLGILGPLLALFVVVLLLYGFNSLRADVEPSGPDRTVVIGADDCESQLVDRCPTQDTSGVIVGG